MPAAQAPTTQASRVVLGVCGGIAAYKAVEVCRRLVDAGVHVAPILTEDAQQFVGALTFSALASEPAQTTLFNAPEPIPHTRLGQSADLIVVAPATAKLIGKYAAGISDDLLTATLLATRAPVMVCPAMHTEMWEHPAVQENLDTLRRRGVHVLAPEVGRLAGGDVGAGRLADPSRIADAVLALLEGDHALAGYTRAGHRGRHARGHRPGPLHRQSVLGEDGPRHRQGRGAPGRPGRARHDRARNRADRRRRGRARSRAPSRCTMP